MRIHTKFFLLYNLLYLTPLAWLALSGIEVGGIGDLSVAHRVLPQIIGVYIIGCSAFCLGSACHGLIYAALGRSQPNIETLPQETKWQISLSDKLISIGVVAGYVIFKILLIPVGVYHSYAFDTGTMTGGVWTTSMALSEALIVLALVFLFSASEHNVIWFLLISAINGVNLLHGTRIFFIVSVLGLLFYLARKNRLSKFVLAATTVVVVFLSYVVFLVRSHLGVAGSSFTLLRIIFPLFAESIFSQLSLISVLNQHLWSALGHPFWFYLDIFSFTVPRALFPDKLSFQFIGRYDYLSPLGAFSGYAQGLLYFGLLFPGFYFIVGVAVDWLRRRASDDGIWAVLYAYVTTDFLFRIMRDGYIIPIKMLLDAIALLCAAAIASTLFKYIRAYQSDEESERNQPEGRA